MASFGETHSSPHLKMEVVVRTAKNGRVQIPVREHWKPDVPSRSRRPVADADVCWWQLKSSAQNALQHLRRRRRHKKTSSSTIPNLKRSDVWVNGKLPLLLLTTIHSPRFDTDCFLLILKQTCHCATWFLTVFCKTTLSLSLLHQLQGVLAISIRDF